MKNNPKVYVISAAHNKIADTKKLIQSVSNQSYQNIEVLFVDDGSSDGTGRWVKKNYPSAHIIEGDGNLWWTGSIHRAIEQVLQAAGENDYILTINSDCTFKKNYVKNIIEFSKNHKQAIIGSVAIDPESGKIVDAGVRIDWKTGKFNPIISKMGDKKVFHQADAISTKGSLYPVKIFSSIGNFDKKNFPHYLSDYEFACRAKKAGYEIIVHRKSKVESDPRNTGYQISRKIKLFDISKLLFSKRSKVNISDHVLFIHKCCPPKYQFRNYTLLIRKAVGKIFHIKNFPVVGLLVSAFFIHLFWSFTLLPFEFPDEQAHFATIALRVDSQKTPISKNFDLSQEVAQLEKSLGTFRDERGINKHTYRPDFRVEYSDSLKGFDEEKIISLNNVENRTTYVKREAARYPFLYYLYSSFFYSVSKTKDIFQRLFVSRIGSVLLATVNVYLSYLVGKRIFGKKNYLLPSLISLQPMMVFAMSGLNSDVLFNLLFTAFTYVSLNIVDKGLRLRNVLFSLGIILLGFYTKPQVYLMIPIMILATIMYELKQRKLSDSIRKLIILLAFLTIVIGIVNPNHLITIFKKGRLPFLQFSIHPNAPSLLEHAKYSLNRLYAQNMVWYWGVFKWLSVVLPSFAWQITNRLILLSGLGSVWYIFKKMQKKNIGINTDKFIFLSLSVVGYILAIFWFDWTYIRSRAIGVGVQARYYFPLFTAQMVLLANGIQSFANNKKAKTLIHRFLIALFISLQVIGIITIIKSYYDITSLQALITQASQYKPYFAKGSWWYIWVFGYVGSLAYLVKINFMHTGRK